MTEQTLASVEDRPAIFDRSAIAPTLAEISSDGGPRTDGDFNALAMLLVDSALNSDEASLRSLQDWLRDECARCTDGNRRGDPELYGRLRGLIDVSHWAIERALPLDDIRHIERGGQANRFLHLLAAEPGLANRELADRLRVNETQVSRVGRKLREEGLVASRLIGRRNYWELTPKGNRTLELLDGMHGSIDLSAESSSQADDEVEAIQTADFGSEQQAVEAKGEEFPARLNRLFEMWFSPSRTRATQAEVISELKAQGISMSVNDLSKLRSGDRKPSATTMTALAHFFRIRPAFFTDDEYYSEIEEYLSGLVHVSNENVKRIALRAIGLPLAAQRNIAEKVEELAREEHCGV